MDVLMPHSFATLRGARLAADGASQRVCKKFVQMRWTSSTCLCAAPTRGEDGACAGYSITCRFGDSSTSKSVDLMSEIAPAEEAMGEGASDTASDAAVLDRSVCLFFPVFWTNENARKWPGSLNAAFGHRAHAD